MPVEDTGNRGTTSLAARLRSAKIEQPLVTGCHGPSRPVLVGDPLIRAGSPFFRRLTGDGRVNAYFHPFYGLMQAPRVAPASPRAGPAARRLHRR